ncbi:retrotransposon ty3-gypsy sub-class, partial [Cystoisospora suis]
KACIKCAKNKTSRQKSGGLLQPLEIPEVPWEEISIDLIVGLPKTSEDYEVIVTIVCRLTKMAHFIPAKMNITAEELAQLLIREVVRLHGVPRAIVSDRDPKFTSD